MGFIKVEYRLQVGRLNLTPAGKIEFFRLTPVQSSQARRRELSLIGALMSRLPILRASYIESGIEFHRFNQLRQPTPPGVEDNFSELIVVA